MEARLDGKVILVTGWTQGIGQAIALECAHSRAKGIIVTGRDARKGEAVVAQLAGLGVEAQMVVADLSSPAPRSACSTKPLPPSARSMRLSMQRD